MNFEVLISKNFERRSKKLLRKYPSLKTDLHALVEVLEQNPHSGVSIGHNLYKIRLSITSKQSGKRGGARVITCVLMVKNLVFLADIYDKSEEETSDTSALLKILKDEGALDL